MMKRTFSSWGVSAFLLAANLAGAQQIGIYTFPGSAGNEATFPVDAQPANATFSDMSRGAGVANSATAAGAFNASGWTTGAIDLTDYYEFTITPGATFSLSLTNLGFAERRSGTSIRDWSVRTSLDFFSTDVATGNVPDDTNFRSHNVGLSASFANVSTSITFRIYGYTAESETGTWRIDDVALYGTLNGSGPPPTNVHFTAAEATVSETNGSYAVTIVKTLASGNVSGQVLLGGTATEGVSADYTVSTTNFTLSGATTSATINITLNNDVAAENSETLIMTLANITGGDAASPSAFTLTITDDDTPPSTVIISEVADPTNNFNARFVELYNAGTSTVNFASESWFLSRQSNGGGTWGDIPLSGLLNPGDAYVVAFSETDYLAAYPSSPAADQYDGNINGNGDDGYFLFKGGDHTNGTLSDIYGEINVDGTGRPWEYLDGRAVRTSTVVQGRTTWDAAEWNVQLNKETGDMTPGVHPDGAVVIVTNVRFAVSSDTALESAGAYIVTVVKTTPDGNVSGQITLGGTATPGGGSDYTLSSTNFTLDGAATTTNITITINDDTDQEPAETIILGFANVIGAGISAPSTFTLTIPANDTSPPVGGVIWINEINYNPEGADSNEFIEVAGPAGINLADYQLLLYNGNGGLVYGSNNLTGVIDDEGCGYGAVSFYYAANGIQNGDPDGIALVSNNTTVLEFLSYGGSFVAADGPALGATSLDVGLVQTNSNDTLQLGGSGSAAGDFAWEVNTASSSNLNINQTIAPCGSQVPPVLAAIGNKIVNESNLLVFAVSATPTDSDPVTLTVSNAPAGSSFTSTNANGTFMWTTPTPTGVFTVSFYASDNDGTDSETITITVTSAPPVVVPPGMNLGLWINEIHYDDGTPISGDTNEGFEVAGPAGVDLADYSMMLYDGVSGGVYSNIPLSGVIPNLSNGYGVIWFGLPYSFAGQIQNGANDGMALVYNGTGVVQFISYEGVVNAVSGPASGTSSTDIGVQENNSTPENSALQLCGTGTNYAQMIATGGWTTNTQSRGQFTSCQVIPAPVGGGSTTIDPYSATSISLAAGTFSITVNPSSNGVPYTLIYTTNLLTNPQGSGTGAVQNGNGGSITLQDVSPPNPWRFYWIRSN